MRAFAHCIAVVLILFPARSTHAVQKFSEDPFGASPGSVTDAHVFAVFNEHFRNVAAGSSVDELHPGIDIYAPVGTGVYSPLKSGEPFKVELVDYDTGTLGGGISLRALNNENGVTQVWWDCSHITPVPGLFEDLVGQGRVHIGDICCPTLSHLHVSVFHDYKEFQGGLVNPLLNAHENASFTSAGNTPQITPGGVTIEECVEYSDLATFIVPACQPITTLGDQGYRGIYRIQLYLGSPEVLADEFSMDWGEEGHPPTCTDPVDCYYTTSNAGYSRVSVARFERVMNPNTFRYKLIGYDFPVDCNDATPFPGPWRIVVEDAFGRSTELSSSTITEPLAELESIDMSGPHTIEVRWICWGGCDGLDFVVRRETEGGGQGSVLLDTSETPMSGTPAERGIEFAFRDVIDDSISGELRYTVEVRQGERTVQSLGPVGLTIDPPARRMRLLVAPNPAEDSAVLRLEAPRPGTFDITVYDLSGRQVAHPGSVSMMEAGSASLVWDGRLSDGRHAPGGIYFAVGRGGNAVARSKFVMVR